MRKDVLWISGLLLILIVVQMILPIRAPLIDLPLSSKTKMPVTTQNESSAAALAGFPPIERYDAMRERPLFVASRRELSDDAEVAVDTGNKHVGVPKFRLTGIINEQNATYAMITSLKPGTQGSRLKIGDTEGGWKVKEITNDRLLLIRAGDEHELLLRTYKSVQPSVSTSKGKVARNKQAARRSASAKGNKTSATTGSVSKVDKLRKRFNNRSKDK